MNYIIKNNLMNAILKHLRRSSKLFKCKNKTSISLGIQSYKYVPQNLI